MKDLFVTAHRCSREGRKHRRTGRKLGSCVHALRTLGCLTCESSMWNMHSAVGNEKLEPNRKGELSQKQIKNISFDAMLAASG